MSFKLISSMWWKYYFETWVYCICCFTEILMILWKKVFSFPVQYLTLLQYSSRMLTSRWQESNWSLVLSQYLFSILYTHLMISLKFVFNEKPPLSNITLSPVKLSSSWDCLARTNFEQNWKICLVVLPLNSVILCSIVWTFMFLILLGE